MPLFVLLNYRLVERDDLGWYQRTPPAEDELRDHP
jgi:hypothetical protein